MKAVLSIFDVVASAFRIPAKQRASEWVEANLRLPPSTNAVAGPLRLASYQRQMIDIVADDAVHTAIFQLASQIGKSLTIDALLGFFIANDPGPTQLVHPSEAKAIQWTRDRWDPLCAASPVLRALTKGGKGNSGNGLRHKTFPGGFLSVGSSHKPEDLAAASYRLSLFDEIERFAASAGREGDPVALGLKRQHMFRLNRKAVISSTPTIKGGRIGQWFARGNQMRFMCACPECGTLDSYSIGMLRFEPGEHAGACLACPHCSHFISDRERLAAVDGGTWHATAPGEPGIVSFYASVLISPFTTLAQIASDYDDAKKTSAKLKVFTNTSLAVDFEEAEAEPLDAEVLAARAEPVNEPYFASVDFISLGCDVQGNRLEATVLLNTMKGGLTAVAHHLVIDGDTSGNEPWAQLDALLGRTFRTVDGRHLPIEISGIDSGFSTSRVYAFVSEQRKKGRPLTFAVKGVSGFDRPVAEPGRRATGATHRIIRVGVDVVKYNVQSRLRMPSFGPGYISLSDRLPPEYFQGLASETLKIRQVRGYDRRVFERTDRFNEALDALVYATAIASLVKAPRTATTTPKETVAEAAARLHAASNPGAHAR